MTISVAKTTARNEPLRALLGVVESALAWVTQAQMSQPVPDQLRTAHPQHERTKRLPTDSLTLAILLNLREQHTARPLCE